MLLGLRWSRDTYTPGAAQLDGTGEGDGRFTELHGHLRTTRVKEAGKEIRNVVVLGEDDSTTESEKSETEEESSELGELEQLLMSIGDDGGA
eukprot:SAG11_NODE_297_length_11092_cov_15.717457_1_plen_92_part_00